MISGIGETASAILFVSAHTAQIEAASRAGMHGVHVARHDQPTSGNHANFGDLDLSGAPAKLRSDKSTSYYPLTPASVLEFLEGRNEMAIKLGGARGDWVAQEMGDGNLNLIFLVRGSAGAVAVKQALPYVRMVGTSWPLPLARAHFERLALLEQAKHVPSFVPAVFDGDEVMALTVMEYLQPHIVLRKGLSQGTSFPHLGAHLGQFLAGTLYGTSDLNVGADIKKRKIAEFLDNTAMCKISEDLIFDEPYFSAPLNFHTSPQLDAEAAALRHDVALKLAVQEMKWCFLNSPEALIHGDLHTGSVMVTQEDTRVIDAEFAFYGPMGFDVGVIIGNLLLAYMAQPGHGRSPTERRQFRTYLLAQVQVLWTTFADSFARSWRERRVGAGGNAFHPRLTVDAPELLPRAIDHRLAMIWHKAVGFAGCELIRRIVGLAHVEDFQSIQDPQVRGECERNALRLGRDLLLQRGSMGSVDDLLEAVKHYG